MESLEQYGWNENTQKHWGTVVAPGLVPARVIADFGTTLKVATPDMLTAELSGKLAHYTAAEFTPKVGDWVGTRLSDNGNATIEVLVPRASEIARKVAGKRIAKQVMAANVDVAFVVLALDGDFSVERLQRFLYQLSINRIAPVIVLNKADQTNDVDGYAARLQSFELPVVVASATSGRGVAEILGHITPGMTAMLLGSSGVGKSTLTNHLLGREAQATAAVRESDATGKHTTVHRELFVLPNGGLLIDAPGIRELQLWGTDDELSENFDDISRLIAQCKYTTCRHEREESCAVQDALKDSSLNALHYANYKKMRAELITLGQKNVARLRRDNRVSRKSMMRRDEELKDNY